MKKRQKKIGELFESPEVIKKAVEESLTWLPEDLQDFLFERAANTNSMEEFIRTSMVGDCPSCGSENTRDTGGTPLDDPTVGICLNCQTLWCLDCGLVIETGQTVCRHWDVCGECGFSTDEGCSTMPWECQIIENWKKGELNG
jgi:hypothetical protein